MWGAGCSYSSCWCNSLGWQRLRTACRYGWKETATARHPACCLAETALYAELERHQDFLAERGIIVSHGTSRRWVIYIGPIYARRLRAMCPTQTGRWHLDEVFGPNAGRQMMYQWRAVDDEGELSTAQSRRDKGSPVERDSPGRPGGSSQDTTSCDVPGPRSDLTNPTRKFPSSHSPSPNPPNTLSRCPRDWQQARPSRHRGVALVKLL